jgi:acetylornithine deacetylase
VNGRSAHGSRYDIGVDAIRHAGLLLAELDRWEREDLAARTHPLLGHASLHAATVSGGVGWSTYPDRCTVTLERRTLPGEKTEDVVREVREACAAVRSRVPAFDATVEHVFSQSPSDVALDAPVVQALERALRGEGVAVRHAGMSAWTDAALLNAAGIPAICFGPGDIARAHADEEWVEVEQVERAAQVLQRLALEWCVEPDRSIVATHA